MATSAVAQWIFILSVWMYIGFIQARGSNLIRYRAVRYGNYYSSVYYSYSGGKGYARYSRVYSHAKNHYPSLYSYMFEWFKTDQYKVYKNTPSGSISVCKNYEANENGTYLGIFTCPLPFVPQDHSYCCGLANAQYCCKFWDVPLNVAAACIAILMGLLILFTFIYIARQICINRIEINEEKHTRKAIRRIGIMRRRGRQISTRSVWAHALFERVHAESKYSEGSISTEEDDVEETERRNRTIETNVINIMKSLTEKHSNRHNNDVTNTSGAEDNIDSEDTTCELSPETRNGKAVPLENGFTGEMPVNKNDRHVRFVNQAFITSWSKTRDDEDIPKTEYALKPLRNVPRIKFDSDSDKRKFSTYQLQ